MAHLKLRFEWDENKAESNYRKHGITFEDATEAFFDRDRIEEPNRIVGGEERWQTIGTIRGFTVLLVIHTIRENGVEVVRIISARHATPAERDRYYGNR